MVINSSFGNYLKVSIFGRSHGPRVSFSLENFPLNRKIDLSALKSFMSRRAGGNALGSTTRVETDAIHFTSGVENLCTTSRRIEGFIANENISPCDYSSTIPRPGHADLPQWIEDGFIHPGGGENSGRLTAALSAAGALCLQELSRRGIHITAKIESICGETSAFDEAIASAIKDGDSVGGVILCEVSLLPPARGGALFSGIESAISPILFAIPGAKGVSFGSGFNAASLRGSENNDAFELQDARVVSSTNNSGGILGGYTTFSPLVLRVAFKPTPSIKIPQKSVNLKKMESAFSCVNGRHDACYLPRAVPVVEAAVAIALLDVLLATDRPKICLTLTSPSLIDARAQLETPFVDLAELRVDLLKTRAVDDIVAFAESSRVPLILTFRRACDGGAFIGSEEERISFFKEILSKIPNGFTYVDFEDDFRHDELAVLANRAGVQIIRSRHCFKDEVKNPYESCSRIAASESRWHEIPKIAFFAKDDLWINKNSNPLSPKIIVPIGDKKLRARAREYGSLWTYASFGNLESLGHTTPSELVEISRKNDEKV